MDERVLTAEPRLDEPQAGRAPATLRAPRVRRLLGFPAVRQAEREARVWSQLWHTTVISGIVTPLLFLGAIGLGLGSLVDDNRTSVAGVDYLVFVAPGILAASAVQSGSMASLWPVMGGIKWTRTFHAAAATPLRPGDVCTGYLLWTATRLTMDSSAFVVVAALLGAVPSPWGVLAVPAAVAGGLSLAAPLTAYSAGRDSDVAFPVVMRVVVVPMFLFSGTFFPLDQLPDALQPIAWLGPLWHAVELCRGATTGSLELLPGVGHAAYLAVWIAAGWWWGVRTFTRKLAP